MYLLSNGVRVPGRVRSTRRGIVATAKNEINATTRWFRCNVALKYPFSAVQLIYLRYSGDDKEIEIKISLNEFQLDMYVNFQRHAVPSPRRARAFAAMPKIDPRDWREWVSFSLAEFRV